MLSKILSKEDCKNCKFCCSFRRQSVWESPFQLSTAFKTEDPNEEVPCDYLDKNSGCTLSEKEKPFDCKIWPFRVMEENEKIYVTIATTCPAINKKSENEINECLNDIIDRIRDEIEKKNCTVKKMNPLYKKCTLLY